MDIFIINLDTQVDRRQFQTSQFEALGLPIIWQPAVKIDDIDDTTFNRRAFDWERPMSRVEVACYYSHFNLWKKIAKSEKPALILEDDALIDQSLPELLSQLEQQEGIDHITLEARGRKKLVAKKTVTLGEHEFTRLYQDRTGAAAYILWPSGAQKLLELDAKRGAALADAQICRAYKMKSFQVIPAPVIQLDCCEFYNIESPHSTQSNILNSRAQEAKSNSFKFKLKRIAAQLRMGRRQIAHAASANRHLIAVKIRPVISK